LRSSLRTLDDYSDAATRDRYPNLSGMVLSPPEPAILSAQLEKLRSFVDAVERHAAEG